MYFIGDVHGLFKAYNLLTKRLPASIQLGDMAIGFPGSTAVAEQMYFPEDLKYRFIRGNHDCPEACRKKKNYLGDFGYLETEKIFFVSGAWSIDKELRVVGVSWWEEEELSREQADAALVLYDKVRPQVMATHDAPYRAYPNLGISYGTRNRTSALLDAMLDVAEPEWWIFAHHHQNRSFQIGKTVFRALAELAVFNL